MRRTETSEQVDQDRRRLLGAARDYWGKPAIREWAKHDIIGESLTMNVTKVINHYGNFIATANVDGNYDKRGLPDPLVLAFYFTPQSELIVQLIILRNRFDI
jgi:hypothetical protein